MSWQVHVLFNQLPGCGLSFATSSPDQDPDWFMNQYIYDNIIHYYKE